MRFVQSAAFPESRNVFLQMAFIVLCSAWASGQPGNIKWTFDTGSGVVAAPAIGDEGIIYVGSSTGTLYAVQPDGTEKWRFQVAQGLGQPPVISPDGTIYVGDGSGKVYALAPDGSLLWTFDPQLNGGLSGEMALAADGTLYAGIAGMVFAINPDGSQFWVFNAGIATPGIAVGPDGVIFVMEANGRVDALNPDGTVKYQVQRSGGAAISFGEDGTIYWGAVSAADSFFALDPDDGSEKWKTALGLIRETASIGSNGDIYVPTANNTLDNELIALDPADGSEKWRFEVNNGGIRCAPAVGFDGTIYVGTDGNEFFALAPDGTQLWVIETNGDVRGSPTIAVDGTVYFGSSDGHLYAVESSSFGLSASSWPKKQRDVRNTGQFGSDVTRRLWFALQVYWLDAENNAVLTMSNVSERVDPAGGGSQPQGALGGTTASFRVDVLNRDGSVFFSIDESVDPGETREIVLAAPGSEVYQGAAIIDAPVKDGSFLAPHLTWNLKTTAFPNTLRIGTFFSNPADAALVHHFPAEASDDNGLGIGVQNIGGNDISCLLELFNSDGTQAAEDTIELGPRASVVQFFNDLVLSSSGSQLQGTPAEFKGRGVFTCDAPVIAVAVNQDFANGGFPTDRVTVKGVN